MITHAPTKVLASTLLVVSGVIVFLVTQDHAVSQISMNVSPTLARTMLLVWTKLQNSNAFAKQVLTVLHHLIALFSNKDFQYFSIL